MKRGRHQYSCSFCGKPREAVRRLIAGPGGVYICNECIALCNEIIAEEEGMSPTSQGQERTAVARPRTLPWWQRLLGRHHRALLRTRTGPGRGSCVGAVAYVAEAGV